MLTADNNNIHPNINIPRGRGRPLGAKNRPKPEPIDASDGVAAQELRQFVERVERLEEEKKALSDDIRDIFAELRGRGFDARAVRKIVAMRKMDRSERMEMEAILELYMQALNMT